MNLGPSPLALTMGEPAGIGGEITLKAWRAEKDSGNAFYVIDDPERLLAAGEALGGSVASPRGSG